VARIQTFDHCGFVVEDIPRAHKFYGQLFGAKPLWMSNLNTHTLYSGWPIISFVELGAHRFELCLAMFAMPPSDASAALPRIGFRLPGGALDAAARKLDELEVAHEQIEHPRDLPIERTIRLRDPDGNVVDLTAWRGDEASGAVSGIIPLTDLSHIALEATDLAEAERFYTTVFGMELISRDASELLLRNVSGQLLFLNGAPALSPRSRFRGPDRSISPDPGGPDRYCGAHLAMTVASAEEYDEMYAAMQAWGVLSEGDIRAGHRPPGEKSDYFYDPAGNRIQLVCFAKRAAAA
jgi:catechol 2,3-dioxygenase-like lactoylglutathione lyase family enzyme